MPEYNHQDYWQGNYINPVIDQRFQPLPPPFNGRTDLQRVPAGTQFDGTFPDADPGKWGAGTGPGHGGRWAWAEDIVLNEFDFKSNGVEGADRGAGSGLFVVRRNIPILLMALDDKIADKIFSIPTLIKQGEVLRLVTVGATLEMIGIPHISVSRVYL